MNNYYKCICKDAIIVNPPNSECNDCFVVKGLTLLCGMGLNPCAGELSYDFGQINKDGVCTGIPQYKALSWDDTLFEYVRFVTVNPSNGNSKLEAKLLPNIDKKHYGKYVEIEYQAKCQVVRDGKTYDVGGSNTIKVCINDMCANVPVNELHKCNKCTGLLAGAENIFLSCEDNLISTCGGTFTYTIPNTNITNCNCKSFEVIKKDLAFETITVSQNQVIDYTIKNGTAAGVHEATIRVYCEYGTYEDFKFRICVTNLCDCKVLGVNEYCDPCTGNVLQKTGNLIADKTGVGYSSSNNGLIAG